MGFRGPGGSLWRCFHGRMAQWCVPERLRSKLAPQSATTAVQMSPRISPGGAVSKRKMDWFCKQCRNGILSPLLMNSQWDLPLVKRIYVYWNTIPQWVPVYTSSAARYPTGKASIPLWIRSIAREFTNARFVNMLCVANNDANTSTKNQTRPRGRGCVCKGLVRPQRAEKRVGMVSWQRGQPSLPPRFRSSKMQNPMILETWILKERVLRDGLISWKKSHDVKTLKFHGVSRMLLEKSIGCGCVVQTAGFKIADFARNFHWSNDSRNSRFWSSWFFEMGWFGRKFSAT